MGAKDEAPTEPAVVAAPDGDGDAAAATPAKEPAQVEKSTVRLPVPLPPVNPLGGGGRPGAINRRHQRPG